MRATPEQLQARWTALLQPLVGRTIAAVRYMNEGDMDAAGWDESAVLLILDDGTILCPSRDDEGNGAGALFINQSDDLKLRGVPDGAPVI